MSLTDDEIRHLVGYARCKFETERYPFAPSLRPVREVLAKSRPKSETRAAAAPEALCAEPTDRGLTIEWRSCEKIRPPIAPFVSDRSKRTRGV